MKVRPLHDRLLVRRIEEKETVKGGIIIPDTAKEKPVEGEVIAVGSGKVTDKGEVRALEPNRRFIRRNGWRAPRRPPATKSVKRREAA